jgi:hypothetical protein
MNHIPYHNIDWSAVDKTEHKGITGVAHWQTMQFDNIRMRIVEYSPDYFADHWCQKGHIVHCLGGSFISELENGEKCTLTKGMLYIVSDD